MTNGIEPRIVNIVSTGTFGCDFNLVSLFKSLDLDEKSYEPETYQALLGKTRNPRGHVTLYRNGKYIITGIDSEKKLHEVFNAVKEELVKGGFFKD